MEGDDPLTSALEMQRRLLEGSTAAVQRSLEVQQSVNEALIEGLDRNREVGERGAAATRDALHAALDAIESTLPDEVRGIDEVRTAVDEQYEMAESVGEDATDAAERGLEEAEELSAASVEALDEQLSALVDAHEEFEEQLGTALDDADGQLAELQETAEGQFADQLAELEARIESFRTALEE